ncbi:MAG: amidohydrolase family protein [Actinomycetota bacterium]
MELESGPPMLVSAPRLITANDEPPLRDAAVRVHDGRIEAVGPRTDLATDGVEERHFPDATLMPGMIDCHEHVAGRSRFSTGVDALDEPDAMWAVVFAHYARGTLSRGVTTLRIPGARHAVDLVVRRAFEEGYGVGPRLVCAGEAIGMTGGHQGAFGRAADGPWACAQAARLQFELGADFIKVMASGGISAASPGELPTHAQLTTEEMRAVVEAAHARDKRVTAHADGERGISNALEAGLDCLEHGIYLTADHARYMAEHGVALVPTLDCMLGIVHRGHEFGLEPSWIDVADEILDVHRRSFQHALDAGVLFATGTDSYGDMVNEIAYFTTFGVDPYRAIQAATRDAAAVISAHADFGTLEAGHSADLIAVAGDPLDDLERLRDVRTVMLRGATHVLDEAALG